MGVAWHLRAQKNHPATLTEIINTTAMSILLYTWMKLPKLDSGHSIVQLRSRNVAGFLQISNAGFS